MLSWWYSDKVIHWRNLIAFFLFGLCNNYAYVIMLSAAEDIMDRQKKDFNSISTSTISTNVGNHYYTFDKTLNNSSNDVCHKVVTSRECTITSTGAVLLADILPALAVKLIFPFFAEKIPFGIRHFCICLLQVAAYFTVAYSTSVTMSLLGVVFAAIGSGWGEITYLALSSFYPKNTILAWSSGTGAAGLVGSFAYAGLTEPNWANLSPKNACLVMQIIPLIFGISYWIILRTSDEINKISIFKIQSCFVNKKQTKIVDTSKNNVNSSVNIRKLTLKDKMKITVGLLKFMIPLGLVYFFEYLINQGLTSLIVFDCSSGFYLSKASQYRWYQSVYQLGVFLSRSSINIFRIPIWMLFVLPILQLLNFLLFTFEAIFYFIPHIGIIFGAIFFEGLVGGAAYVNTFDHIHKISKEDEKEFSLSVATQGDCFGITLSGFISIFLHNTICNTKFYPTLY
ncbi:Battenin [Strongyloides ratti]|uniref:Battenin n=1 Tax=Strongyloides ratti TaxID=34506 RepID=A0A090LL02_STRRB|nr:Battenin [Strongyloides ratti]CEF68195.1 Battenin [Strongyloides ratti]